MSHCWPQGDKKISTSSEIHNCNSWSATTLELDVRRMTTDVKRGMTVPHDGSMFAQTSYFFLRTKRPPSTHAQNRTRISRINKSLEKVCFDNVLDGRKKRFSVLIYDGAKVFLRQFWSKVAMNASVGVGFNVKFRLSCFVPLYFRLSRISRIQIFDHLAPGL